MLISKAQVTTKSHRDVHSLCCHLKPCWCPCCFYPLLMCLTCTSTRGHVDICCLWCHLRSLLVSTFLLWLGDVWFHWPVTLLKGKWISFVWCVTWNHVAVHGPYCPFRLCWYAWPLLSLEVVLMTIVFATNEGLLMSTAHTITRVVHFVAKVCVDVLGWCFHWML